MFRFIGLSAIFYFTMSAFGWAVGTKAVLISAALSGLIFLGLYLYDVYFGERMYRVPEPGSGGNPRPMGYRRPGDAMVTPQPEHAHSTRLEPEEGEIGKWRGFGVPPKFKNSRADRMEEMLNDLHPEGLSGEHRMAIHDARLKEWQDYLEGK